MDANGVPEPGTLLVAAPSLQDPNFARTVVLMIDHRESGSLGVILNRPSEVDVEEILPTWGRLAADPRSLYVGGPVEQRAALCVAAVRTGVDPEATEGLIGVQGRLALVDLDGDVDEVAPQLAGLRVFAGYAGWGEGQLDGEIERHDWIVVPALPDDVLAPASVDLWSRVLRRQGTPLAWLATHPGDVSVN